VVKPHDLSSVVEPCELAAGHVDTKEDPARMLGEPEPRRCGTNRPALQQLVADLLLQGGDLLGHGRLGVAQLGCGGSERPRPHDRHQSPKVAQFHGRQLVH